MDVNDREKGMNLIIINRNNYENEARGKCILIIFNVLVYEFINSNIFILLTYKLQGEERVG